MMKLKDFKLLIFIISAPFLSFTQVDVFGEVYDKVSVKGLESVEIYDEFGALPVSYTHLTLPTTPYV